MKHTSLDVLACPFCCGSLRYNGETTERIWYGVLVCTRCRREFPVEAGIPCFIQSEILTGYNRRFSHLYNWFSWVYAAFSRIAFAYIGVDEATGRREITDRLAPQGGRVLEVSIGPGVNLPYLVPRPDVGEVLGLDISPGQLRRCQRYVERTGWDVDLLLGNGEQLPFQDDSFGGVFDVGGINFFNHKESAIREMIRVARPGARILIADETEKGAQAYEKFIPGFRRSLAGKHVEIVPPIDLVPDTMLEKKVSDIWKGWLYCIEFVKP